MRPATRWAVIGLVAIAAIVILIFKSGDKPNVMTTALATDTTAAKIACCPSTDSSCCGSSCCPPGDTLGCATEEEMAADNAPITTTAKPKVLPRFLELGSVGCKACADMAPIVEQIKAAYTGCLSVEFYDVREDPAPAEKYGIKLIPTQIFIDSEGREIFRHEGFLAKDDILPILAKMGIKP
jgi:thioredoxin 1